MAEKKFHWDNFIDDVEFSINSAPQSSTEYSPFFLMFGRTARQPLEVKDMSGVCIMGAEEPHEWVEGIQERKEELLNEVQENQAKAHKRKKGQL